MRFTFAAALIAASASALDTLAIPDYVAGFIYGMTGDNHLQEIETCFNGSESLISEAHDALTDIQSGNWVKAVTSLTQVFKQFPDTLTNCKDLDADIATIESWATIFTQPEDLLKEASKNFLLHRKTIMGDISDEQAHWATGQYFNAGIDTAMALTELLPMEGQVVTVRYQEEQPVGMPLFAFPTYVAGVIYGMVGQNHLTEIQTCATDGSAVLPQVEAALKDLENGQIAAAIIKLGKIMDTFPTILADCKNTQDDLKAIEAWATIFTNKSKLVATVTKNFLLHKKGVKADIADMKTEWAADQFFQAGVTAADIVIKTVGPINPVTSAFQFDAMALPDFIAGFIYGMTGDNDLAEIESCFQANQEMYTFLNLAIGDLKKGGWDNDVQAALEFGLVALMFPQALSTCEGMGDDIAAIEEWAQVFTDIPALTATITKHYLLHKKAIKADIAAVEADYDAGNWFQCGVDTADLATLAIGPIQ